MNLKYQETVPVHIPAPGQVLIFLDLGSGIYMTKDETGAIRPSKREDFVGFPIPTDFEERNGHALL